MTHPLTFIGYRILLTADVAGFYYWEVEVACLAHPTYYREAVGKAGTRALAYEAACEEADRIMSTSPEDRPIPPG